MKEMLQKHKAAAIVGIIVLVVIIVVGSLFIIRGNQDKEPDKEIGAEVDTDNKDKNQDEEKEEENEEESGGIIVEDNSSSDDDANEEEEEGTSFQLGEDEDIDDVLINIIQNNEGITRLVQEDIDRINNEIFLNEAACYWPNMFLSTYYSCPEEINLGMVFYMGLSPEERESASQEEVLKIMKLGHEMWGDATKIPADRLEQIINTYTGLSISDYQEQIDGQFVYLAEYNTYYRFLSDAFYISHAIEDGYRTATGELVLLYRQYCSGEDQTVSSKEWINQVTLKETADGGFQFISNEIYGVKNIEDIQIAISDWADYDYIGTVDSYEKSTGKITIQGYEIAEENTEPYFADLTESEKTELVLAEDCQIIIAVSYVPFYLETDTMELLQDKDCFKDKMFFICVKDGKIVKLIENTVLRLNIIR